MLTEEQKRMRRNGIGASEIAVLLGETREYKSPLDLYYEKTGEVEDPDLSGVEAIYWGNSFEENIAQRYAELNDVKLTEPGTMAHKDYPFILATPDRLIEGQKKGLEVKTVGRHALHKWGAPGSRKIPKNYFLQVAQCMYVMDYDSWDLAALMCGQELQIYTFERDKDFDEIIKAECSKFWNEHVIPRIPPPVDYDYPNVTDTLKKIYSQVEDEEVPLDMDLLAWVDVWKKAKEDMGRYKKIADNAQAHLLDEMKNAKTGLLPDGNWLQRSLVKRKAYEVKASEYVTLSYKERK